MYSTKKTTLDVFFSLFVGTGLFLIHRNSEERFREARKQLTDALEGKNSHY